MEVGFTVRTEMSVSSDVSFACFNFQYLTAVAISLDSGSSFSLIALKFELVFLQQLLVLFAAAIIPLTNFLFLRSDLLQIELEIQSFHKG
ncbi:hypothetical protein VNO77_30028 [Canavalia gladiata]|uniref:Uncharacterized protein n=1 Tax=Canavalia gladiata TaxID=3824 RepID=A0AAN9KR56_CANGL